MAAKEEGTEAVLCSNQDELFHCTVKVCACVLLVNAVVGLLILSAWHFQCPILSEDRLSNIQQRGAATRTMNGADHQ